jgi:hypothetical protein
MRLDDQRESGNIEDRRGGMGGLPGFGDRQGAGGLGGGGGLPVGLIAGLLPLIFSRFGIVGVLLVGGALLLFGGLGGGGGGIAPQSQVGFQPPPQAVGAPRAADATASFVAKVLATTEDAWGEIFRAGGETYPPPTLVLFEGRVSSACGLASSASGPFYCPGDRKVYLDMSFFDELSRRFGAPGDFAAAYVIAHEVGHHVQTVTGISQKVQQAQRRARSQADANEALMRLELQADCFAGVWAARNRDILDAGDFAEGVRAAEAIGDDTLQRQTGRAVVPDSFTHGSSAQRVRWLTRGFETGDPNACDTFGIPASQL